MFLWKSVLIVLVFCLLAACGGSGDLPPKESNTNSSALLGSVEGKVSLSSGVKNATVTVYEYDNGQKGKRLASTTTLEDGSFFMRLQSLTRPILVESIGGEYKELSSGVTVNIKDTQRLQLIAYYDEGADLSSLSVTPLSYISKALLEYQMREGAGLSAALASANTELNKLYAINSPSLLPQDISSSDLLDVSFEQYQFGFLLAGLSSLSQSISEANGDTAHVSYTSIALVQAFYNDMVADGILDGQGFNAAQDLLVQLAFGIHELNVETYRIDLSQHLLAMVIHSENRTLFNVEDLLEYALNLINQESDLLEHVGEAASDVALYNLTPEGIYHNGTFDFSVLVNKPELVERISFDINGIPLLGQVIDKDAPKITIDTLSYEEGEHSIGVTVEDLLGNTLYEQYTVHFDNTTPFVNIFSDNVTNLPSIELTGEVGDNGSGIRAVSIQGSEVELSLDNAWNTSVSLEDGANIVPITLLDWAGNEYVFEAIAIRDVNPPNIDLLPEQSFVRFSNGDGSFAPGSPALENSSAIFIATDKTDLGSIAMNREMLESEEITFLAFDINDPVIEGAGDYDGAITVEMEYERNGITHIESREIVPVEDQYLIPLVTEFFSDDWLASLPTDLNDLLIRAQDKVGNVSEVSVGFALDFVVSDVEVATSDEFATTVESTSFDERDTLYGNEYLTMTYEFENTTNNPFYMTLEGVGTHSSTQTIDSMVREHLARLQTQTEWQHGAFADVDTICSEDVLSYAGVTVVTKVYEYDGVGFQEHVAPSSLSDILRLTVDFPDDPATSDWVEATSFWDSNYAPHRSTEETILGTITLTYEYDLVLSTTIDGLKKPAIVRNWERSYSDGSVDRCNDAIFFNERQVYSYISEEGYPRNELTSEDINAVIDLIEYQVYNDTLGEEVVATDNGWYHVPEGHTITINKRVTLPEFTVYNDEEVASPETFTSYTLRSYDKTITWDLDNTLSLVLAHDAGEENILSMTANTQDVDPGEGVYQLGR